MTLEAENEIVEAAAALLHEARDPAWAEVVIEIAFADGMSQFRTWFRTSYDGAWQQTGRYAESAERFAGLFAGLRRLMYREHAGTWFSARLTVSDQGDFRSDYDYESEPRFDPPAPRELFIKDLQTFPRDPSLVPSWVGAGA